MTRRWIWVALLTLMPAAAGAAAPTRGAATFQQGIELKKAGKLAEARDVFQSLVRKNPKDADALEQLATVQGWLGSYDDSVKTWEKAMRLNPESDDYQLGMARVLYWQHENNRALGILDGILARSPRNADALVLKGDVLSASGDDTRARAAYLDARSLAPDNPEIAKKLDRTAAPARFRLDLGYLYDHYGNARGREYSSYAQVGWSFTKSDNLWVREDYLRYFGSTDRMFQVGGAVKLPYLLVLPSVGGTSKPHFRPNSQADLGLEAPIVPWLTPLFGYRYYHYPNGNVRMVIPGVRVQPVPWGNVEYRYGINRNTDSTITKSYSLRANAYVGEHVSPYVGYAHGIEDIPPQASAKVTYYSVGSVIDVTPRLGFRLDYTYEDRPLFYQHHSEGAGVTIKF